MTPRRAVVVLLLITGSLAAFAASFAIWLNRQALSAEGWSTTSADLIASRQIRTAVGDYAVAQLLVRTNLGGLLGSVLPRSLADAAVGQVRAAGRRLAAGILATSAARRVWITANRQAHRQLLAILARHRRGNVTLNLEPLLLDLVTALDSSAPVRALPGAGQKLLALGSPTAGQVPVLSADQVDRARGAVNAIRGLSVVLSIAAVALLAGAIAAARRWRSVAVAWTGGCLAAVGGLVLLARVLLAPALADALVTSSDSPARPAAHAAWLISTTELRFIAIAILIAGGGLVVAGLVGRTVTGRRG